MIAAVRRGRAGPGGRHEALGDRQLLAAERPAPGHVLRAVGAVEIGVGAHDVGALARDAVEDVAVDPVGGARGRRPFEPGEERARALLAEEVLEALAEREAEA